MKKSNDSIEPATSRFVVQCLCKLHHRVPQMHIVTLGRYSTLLLRHLSQDSSSGPVKHEPAIGFPPEIKRARSSIFARTVFPTTSTRPDPLTCFVLGFQKLRL
jgi:hypothetical protein